MMIDFKRTWCAPVAGRLFLTAALLVAWLAVGGCTRTVERERGWIIEPAASAEGDGAVGEVEITIERSADGEEAGEPVDILAHLEAEDGPPLRVGVPHGAWAEELDYPDDDSEAADDADDAETDHAAIEVRDIDGQFHKPLAFESDADDDAPRLSTVIFITPDCPIANRTAPAIGRIIENYADRVRFYLVHVSERVDPEQAREHAEEYGYIDLDVPILLDHDQELVEAVEATVTPEAAVVDAAGALLYRGRINDQWADFTVRRPEPRRHDLREALDEALAGDPVSEARLDAIGCFILRHE